MVCLLLLCVVYLWVDWFDVCCALVVVLMMWCVVCLFVVFGVLVCSRLLFIYMPYYNFVFCNITYHVFSIYEVCTI